MEKQFESDKDRAEKIVQMQHLVDEALAGGISDQSLDDIRSEARQRARVSPTV